jgi:uncharacterized membrane protein
MRAEFLVLRFIHVVGAIVWVGGGVYVAFFLIPALLPTRELMPQVMEGLRRRKALIILPTIGLLVVLSGVRLLWIDSAGFAESFLSTGPGRTFSIGGAAGILAFLIQAFVQLPSGRRLGRIAAVLASSPPKEQEERLIAQADRMRRLNAIGVISAAAFGLIGAMAMSIARYM